MFFLFWFGLSKFCVFFLGRFLCCVASFVVEMSVCSVLFVLVSVDVFLNFRF